MSFDDHISFLQEMDDRIYANPNTWLDDANKNSVKRLLQLFNSSRIFSIGRDFKSPLIQLLWLKTSTESSDHNKIKLLKYWYSKHGADFKTWPSVFHPILHDACASIYRMEEFNDPAYESLFQELIAALPSFKVPYFSHLSKTGMLYITEYPTEYLEHAAYYMRLLTQRSLMLHDKNVKIPPLSPQLANIFAGNDTAFLFALQNSVEIHQILYLKECFEVMPSRQAQALVHVFPKSIGRCSEKLSLDEYVDVLNNTFDPNELWNLADSSIEIAQFTKKEEHLLYLKDTYPHILAYQYIHGTPPYSTACEPFIYDLMCHNLTALSVVQWIQILDSSKADSLFAFIKDRDHDLYQCWVSSEYTIDTKHRSSIMYQYIHQRFLSGNTVSNSIDIEY